MWPPEGLGHVTGAAAGPWGHLVALPPGVCRGPALGSVLGRDTQPSGASGAPHNHGAGGTLSGARLQRANTGHCHPEQGGPLPRGHPQAKVLRRGPGLPWGPCRRWDGRGQQDWSCCLPSRPPEGSTAWPMSAEVVRVRAMDRAGGLWWAWSKLSCQSSARGGVGLVPAGHEATLVLVWSQDRRLGVGCASREWCRVEPGPQVCWVGGTGPHKPPFPLPSTEGCAVGAPPLPPTGGAGVPKRLFPPAVTTVAKPVLRWPKA